MKYEFNSELIQDIQDVIDTELNRMNNLQELQKMIRSNGLENADKAIQEISEKIETITSFFCGIDVVLLAICGCYIKFKTIVKIDGLQPNYPPIAHHFQQKMQRIQEIVLNYKQYTYQPIQLKNWVMNNIASELSGINTALDILGYKIDEIDGEYTVTEKK